MTNERPKAIELNSYQLFEEPSKEQIKNLQFYFLGAAWGSAENTYLLSIRKDKNNVCYGYYKVIDRDMMPPIGNVIKTDTLPFIYTTTYFKLSGSDIDTVQKLLQTYNINTLKDSVQSNHVGGRYREIIVLDNGNLYDVFRSYGNEASIEKNFVDFLKAVTEKFIPPEPVPSFRR